jgi:tryptophan 2,3-dioxygenase
MSEISKEAQKELKQSILAGIKLPAISFSLRGLLSLGRVSSHYGIVLKELQDYISQNPKYNTSLVIIGSEAFIYADLMESSKDILCRFVDDNSYNKALKNLTNNDKVSAQINQEVETFRTYTTPDLKREVESLREAYESMSEETREVERKAVILCLHLAEFVLYSRSLKGKIEAFFLRKFRTRPDLTNLEREILIDAE